MAGKMSKRTIILIVLAVVLFIAAVFSLFFEKQAVETELDNLLNGRGTETTNEPGTETTNGNKTD